MPSANRPWRSRHTISTCGAGGRPLGQDVHDLSPFKVDHDSSIGLALAPCPVIDADHPYRSCAHGSTSATLEVMHDSVVTGREAEASQKAFSRLSARGMPEQMNEIQHAARSAKPRLGDPGYALDKNLPPTVAIAAPEPRNP